MSTFPTNAALEAAIIAHADEDTPRLAYADWLDENGDPDRAAFIRVQCRLADTSPGNPEWVDLIEQQDELLARLRPRQPGLCPKSTTRINLDPDRGFGDDRYGDFHRGFPYLAGSKIDRDAWNPEETTRLIDELTDIVRTSTIRAFDLNDIPQTALKQLLAAPVARQLRTLMLSPNLRGDWSVAIPAFHQLVATSPVLRGVRDLRLSYIFFRPGAAALTNATVFDAVRRMTMHDLRQMSKQDVVKLTKAAWFQRLRHFRAHGVGKPIIAPLIAGLGRLPQLHTLELCQVDGSAKPALAAGKFPALARLVYDGALWLDAAILAGARFPSLVAFEATGQLEMDGLAALLRAEWFPQLRVLDLGETRTGPKGLKALASHPVAKSLRVLKIHGRDFGKPELAVFTKPGAFPALTTLSLESVYGSGKGTPLALAAQLAAIQLPTLRHLSLGGLPLGDAGAKGLAKNPCFAGLTRLRLKDCGIGDAGAKAIFKSPHLRNLVELHLNFNHIKSSAAALVDPTVLPRLGVCWLKHNKIPEKTVAKLLRLGLCFCL